MIWNAVLLSLRELRRNILRSCLTILGIVIGVAAVITMVTIGSGATAQVTQQIASMGSNILLVSPGKRMGPGQSTIPTPFKISDAEAIAKDIASVKAVAPTSTQSAMAIFGNENWSTTVTATNNEYFSVTNRYLRTGRTFSEGELRAGAAICILGETVRKKLFGGQNGLGERIRLNKLSCEVIGLLGAKGQNTMGMDQDDLVVLPMTTFQRRIAGNQEIGMIHVSVKPGESVEKVQQRIEEMLRERRHISLGKDDDFHVMDMKEITKMLTGTTKTLTALFGAVAAVSLLVGGIGIMNIMLVSVTERTREIGIRLAIGALEREVLMQFLVEAIVLSSLGGLTGIVLALIASVVLTAILNVPFIFNPNIIVIAFLFSVAIGMLFGYFPALKAARLDPIEALRNE
jgi:putative ABC transport system permease protein